MFVLRKLKSSNFYQLMKTRYCKFVMLAVLFVGSSNEMKAQEHPFFYGVECHSGNFYSSFLGLPTSLLNSLVGGVGGGISERFRIARFNNAGSKMGYDGNNFFGFKGEDLFRDFEYHLRLGWQPTDIPVGFFARAGYRHENFNTQLSDGDDWVKHRVNTFRPGLGLRISPLENLVDEYNWCPIIEIGSIYNCHFKYKGAYNSDKKQLNNGVSSFVSIGGKIPNYGVSILLNFEYDHYDLFNTNFSYDGMAKPYEKVKSSRWNIGLQISTEI